jgi:hypothetical protein
MTPLSTYWSLGRLSPCDFDDQALALAENTLFSYIETLQGGTPWGKVGTGWSSLGWLTGLTTERLTAVTACSRRAEALRSRYQIVLRPQDAVVVGNWVDTDLLRGEVFDVVLADYLVGAVDRFAPYFQGRCRR